FSYSSNRSAFSWCSVFFSFCFFRARFELQNSLRIFLSFLPLHPSFTPNPTTRFFSAFMQAVSFTTIVLKSEFSFECRVGMIFRVRVAESVKFLLATCYEFNQS
ncbi:CLUMA_CG005864, isoform A, partial [Clunio marinus]